MKLTHDLVERWKNSGTISTMPPTATTRRTRTIMRRLLVSTRSWPAGFVGDALMRFSGAIRRKRSDGGSQAAAPESAGCAGACVGSRPARTVITTFHAMTSMPTR